MIKAGASSFFMAIMFQMFKNKKLCKLPVFFIALCHENKYVFYLFFCRNISGQLIFYQVKDEIFFLLNEILEKRFLGWKIVKKCTFTYPGFFCYLINSCVVIPFFLE